MSSDLAVQVSNLGKCFHIYEKPSHRLWQMLNGERKKYYREFWALNDVSFSVKRGESIGIVGLNGSGKSTLLRMIGGTLHPTHGNIQIKGRVAALLELGSGFNMEFTGRENVFLYAALFGLTRQEIESRFSRIEAFAEIGDFINQPVKTYSSGMYVRLAFSVIANIDADILVIDEALSVGDAFFQQKCMRYLRSFNERGTLLLVTHDSGAIINLCNRALWLNAGKLQKDAAPNDVVDAYMANLYEINQGKSDPQFQNKINSDVAKPIVNLFTLDPAAPSFGTGDAIIQDISIENAQGIRMHRLAGGEHVSICISAAIKNNVEQPIIGFQIKDRLGQVIFGNNTYLKYEHQPFGCQRHDVVVAKFSFVMPIMMAGIYTIQAAIANGTLTNHIQLHWVHDAIIFEMQETNKRQLYFDGIVYVPMENIEITLAAPANDALAQ